MRSFFCPVSDYTSNKMCKFLKTGQERHFFCAPAKQENPVAFVWIVFETNSIEYLSLEMQMHADLHQLNFEQNFGLG